MKLSRRIDSVTWVWCEISSLQYCSNSGYRNISYGVFQLHNFRQLSWILYPFPGSTASQVFSLRQPRALRLVVFYSMTSGWKAWAPCLVDRHSSLPGFNGTELCSIAIAESLWRMVAWIDMAHEQAAHLWISALWRAAGALGYRFRERARGSTRMQCYGFPPLCKCLMVSDLHKIARV